MGRLATGSVPLTALTLVALSRLDIHGVAARQVLTGVLSGALFLTATALIFRQQILVRYASRTRGMDPRHTAVLTTAVGAVLGVLVSISSVGAGAIGVTALILLYPRLPMARIVGSDIAHAVPLTLVAGIGHWMLGSVDWNLFASLLAGSLPGIFLGSYMATRVPEAALRLVLAVTLLVVGGRLLI